MSNPVTQSSAPAGRNERVFCWGCHTRGHVQAYCPLQDETMKRLFCYARRICAIHLDLIEGQFKCDLCLNQFNAQALLRHYGDGDCGSY